MKVVPLLRRRPSRGRWVATLVLLVVLGGATSARAVDQNDEPVGSLLMSQCSLGSMCVWSAVSYGGTFLPTTSAVAVSIPFGTTRSAWNRATKAARIYAGAGGTGSSVCLTPGQSISSTTIASSSMRILTTVTC